MAISGYLHVELVTEPHEPVVAEGVPCWATESVCLACWGAVSAQLTEDGGQVWQHDPAEAEADQ